MSTQMDEEFESQEQFKNDNEGQNDSSNGQNNDQSGNKGDSEGSHIIKLRGLPWTVTTKDIVNFLKDIAIVDGENGVHLITYSRNSTRPNGEAFVECATEDDFKKSFYYNKKTIGKRYIEIFSARREDFENIMKKQNIVQHDTVVKLRGLPWRVTEEEIEKFFDGLELNKEKGVHIHLDRTGRASGEAFVQFESTEDCEKALKRNMEKIGHRYIEIFRSSAAELRRSMSQNSSGNDRPSPYDRNSRGDRGSRMRNFGDNDFGNSGRNNMRGMDSDRRGGRFGAFSDNDNWNDNGMWDNRNSFNFGNGGNSGNGFGNNGFGNFGNSGNDFANDRFGGSNNGGGGNFGFGMFSNNSNSGGGGNGYGALNTLGFGGLSDLRNNRGNNSNFSGSNSNFSSNNFDGNIGGGNMGGGSMGGGGNIGGGNMGGGNMGGGNMGGSNMGGGNMGGGNNNGGNNLDDFFSIHLRGMPYYCDEVDIMKFFNPLKPVHCNVIYNNKGMHSGSGNAFFKTNDEAEEAMKRDKDKMGSRYIELFLDNPQSNKNRRRF